MNEVKSHSYMTWKQLAYVVGLPADAVIRKVWVEPDNDYIHFIAEHQIHDQDRGLTRVVAEGGHVEAVHAFEWSLV